MKGYPSDNGAKKHRRLDASPPPAHAMPPHQGVQRSTTSPRQGDHPVHGDDHLADADTTPLCQPLRHSREITPRKNGGATTSPTATPCLYATLSTVAGRSPRGKNGGNNLLADGDPARLCQPLRRGRHLSR